MGEKSKNERIKGWNAQVRKQEEKMSKGDEKGRWMIGYLSHPRSRSTNIGLGGIYSYKLSAGAS